MTEERGFEVVDRRRVHTAESDESASDAAESSAGLESDEDAVENAEEDGSAVWNPFAQMGVADVVRMTLSLLHDKAWVSMGLLANPATGRVEQDLAEARRAIDVVVDLVKHLEPLAAAEEKREMQVLLSNLRINYVRQSEPGP
jgi:hypothetical protein